MVKKRILTIDGGGMRGMFSLLVLMDLEKALGMPIYEAFDLIGGTSTGGIIALGLLLRMRLSDILELYETLGEKVFRYRFGAYTRFIFAGNFYGNEQLENILKSTLGPERKLEDYHDAQPKVFVVSCDATTTATKPYLFRSYESLDNDEEPTTLNRFKFNGTSEAFLWEAGRATSAGPGYFSPHFLHNRTLVDGGLVANNPAWIALCEAAEIWGPDSYDVIVSVGNGIPQPSYGGARDILKWGKTCVDLLTSSDNIYIETGVFLKTINYQGIYSRLDPENCYVELDETSPRKIALCVANVRQYLDKPKIKAEIARVAKYIKDNLPEQLA